MLGKYLKRLLLYVLISVIGEAQFPAYRVCKPGPALDYPVNAKLKNCLIIGDSVSIGYTSHVKEMLNGICQVQHAPWDTRDGGALDTKYALQCMSLFLSTVQGKATHYDAIIFNSGIHDVQYCPGKYVEEYVPYQDYLSNIKVIANRLNLTGAKLGFVSSTPIPYNVVINNRIKKYNSGVKPILNATGVEFVDLYEKVVNICGEPPFKSCFIMDAQPSPHYKQTGYTYLAVFVSKLFLTLLNKPQNPGTRSMQSVEAWTKITEKLRHREELGQSWKICKKVNFITESELKRNILERPSSCMKSNYLSDDIDLSYQLNITTACPSTMTCCRNTFSNTGIGCCVIPNAITCTDSLHCCPQRMTCSKNCGKGNVLCSCENPSKSKKRFGEKHAA